MRLVVARKFGAARECGGSVGGVFRSIARSRGGVRDGEALSRRCAARAIREGR